MQGVGLQAQGPSCCVGRGPGEARGKLLLRVWGLEETWAPAPREVRSREPQPRPLNSGPQPGARGSPGHQRGLPNSPSQAEHANATFLVSSSVRQDFDVPTNHLIGAHNYCTQVGGRGRGWGTGASPSLFSSSWVLPALGQQLPRACLCQQELVAWTGPGPVWEGTATTSLCMFTAGPSGASWGRRHEHSCLSSSSQSWYHQGKDLVKSLSVSARTGSHRPPLPACAFL